MLRPLWCNTGAFESTTSLLERGWHSSQHKNVLERQQWCVGKDDGIHEPFSPEPSISRQAYVWQSLKLAAVDEGRGGQLVRPKKK